MNYWWVNHKQTARQEIGGGYLWSPQRTRDGKRSQYYEFMREARPGDAVVSFANAQIGHFEIVSGFPLAAPKPKEFGTAGENWSHNGWLVPVKWEPLETPFRPKDHIEQLRPRLPERYSPIQDNGNGNQAAYLTRVGGPLFEQLMRLGRFDPAPSAAMIDPADDRAFVDELEDNIERRIQVDVGIDQTEREAVIKARRGQGLFRRNVEAIEPRCRVTGLEDRRLLVASHIKPWRLCDSSAERLDGANGLLLAPSIDRLFDLGLISFGQDGAVLLSHSLDPKSRACLGLARAAEQGVGQFSREQDAYLAFHRTSVLLP